MMRLAGSKRRHFRSFAVPVAAPDLSMPRFPRLARLAAAALALGAAAGLATAADISSSKRSGRIGALSAPAAPVEEPFAQPDDPALAQAHGFALAAQLQFRRAADCRTVRPEFRSGCLDYVEAGPGEDGAADIL
jgi:hypothetical protein